MIIAILISIKYLSKVLYKFNFGTHHLFIQKATVTILSKLQQKKNQRFRKWKNLVQFVNDSEEKIYIYKFATATSASAKEILKKLKNMIQKLRILIQILLINF